MSSGRAGYWRRIIVGNVIASAIVLFAFNGATFRTPPRDLALNFGISFLFSSVIGPLLGFIMPRVAPWIWRRTRFPFNWVGVSAVMVVMAMVGTVVSIAILVAVGYVPANQFGRWLQGSLRISVVITLTIGLFITAYEVMKARMAQTAAEAKLASLESRVQPHFLFNTLNSIAALIHEDPQGAERMTGQLASLLRSSLDQQSQPLVTLEDELRLVRDYLAIEQVRFGDRLRFSIEADAAAGSVRLPRLALQTLVENSVKYAVTPRREGAAIAIRATTSNGHTQIVVEDDGPGFDAANLPAGHGLALLRARLALLFGDRASLTIDAPAGRSRSELTIPDPPSLHRAPADKPASNPPPFCRAPGDKPATSNPPSLSRATADKPE